MKLPLVIVHEKERRLVELLRADPAFAGLEFDQALEQSQFVGRAPQQVDEFLADAKQVDEASLKRTPAEVAVLGSVHSHHACM